MSKQDIFTKVTAQLLAAMEESKCNWQKPWLPPAFSESGLARNASTGKYYKGGNAMLLGFMGGGLWATYKQWQALGAQVKKGESATPCVKWTPIEKKDEATGVIRKILIPCAFSVFRFSQVDGYTIPAQKERTELEKHAEAQAIVDATGARIEHAHQDSAFYRPASDSIHMPHLTQWNTQGEYYGTLLHELTHWTGHSSRLDRIKSLGISTSEEYAKEELVAEIGSALLLAHCGLSVTPRQDHAQYLASWIRHIKDDPRAFFTAASKAQKAVDFILPEADEQADTDTEEQERAA